MKNKLSIVRNNHLHYEGKSLWADVLGVPYCSIQRENYMQVSPGQLEDVLQRGNAFITAALLSLQEQQQAQCEPQGRTADTPLLCVAQLGSDSQTSGCDSRIYSVKGCENEGSHLAVDELSPQFARHWRAVENAGFIPQVANQPSSARLANDGGAYLMLRNIEQHPEA